MKRMNDNGFATVLVVSVTAVISILGMTFLTLGLLLSARAQVQRAADLVALAAAPISEEEPCDVARDVAHYNGVTLRDCQWHGGQVNVVVDRPTGLTFMPTLTAGASARATGGPY